MHECCLFGVYRSQLHFDFDFDFHFGWDCPFFFLLCFGYAKKKREDVYLIPKIFILTTKSVLSQKEKKNITTPFTTSSVANNTGLPFTTNTTAPEND